MQLSTSGSARGIGGETYVYSTSVKQLTLDKYSVRNLTLPVIAVDAGPAFDMILGENFFSHSTVEFDLAHSAIRLFDPKGCHAEQLSYWSTAYQLADLIASPVDSNRIETTVLLNGKALRAVLDTGAMFSIVSLTAAATAGVTPDSPGVKPAGRWHGVGRNVVDSWIGTFDSFTIGDETIRNAKLVIQDRTKSDEVKALQSRIPVSVEASPMLIGADFFLAHRVLIYGAERKMVFTYLGGPVFDTLHVHPEAPTAAGSDDRPQTRARPLPGLLDDAILEVQDQRVGAEPGRLAHHVLAIGGDKQRGTNRSSPSLHSRRSRIARLHCG